MKKSIWFTRLIGALAGLFILSITALIVVEVASAQDNPFPLGLRSRLAADYSQETAGATFGPMRLSIVREVLQDLGLASSEVDAAASNY